MKNLCNKPEPSTGTHPIDKFFEGISASVKNLPPRLQLEAKRCVSDIVFNLEYQALQEQPVFNSHLRSPYTSSASITPPNQRHNDADDYIIADLY
ncbi:unnamed protein product [Bemisia tabaci]|uniref:BESS domain-containing protein n=1 Tax=Bemisia tabaci TaxID=7038 RepID=A0A9P0EZD9_BEMTA|nr:PREDICTED: uncharacterized protein LOC109036907 [Bemisia tabaci]CAH0383219.1 unnamed protein product [Bemisia tabaci]